MLDEGEREVLDLDNKGDVDSDLGIEWELVKLGVCGGKEGGDFGGGGWE